MISSKFKVPLYFGTVIIIHTDNFEEVNKKHNTEIDKTFEAVTFQKIKKSGGIEYLVAFQGKVEGGIIAHEVTHLVNMIFKHCYMQLDLNNDEPQAYLAGFIFEKIEKFLIKNGKRK